MRSLPRGLVGPAALAVLLAALWGVGAGPAAAQATPSLRIEVPTIVEGAAGPTTDVEVVVEQSVAMSEPVSWRWATLDMQDFVDEWRPTTPGVDYVPAGGIVTFEPGETTKTVTVTVLDDTMHEPGEFVALSAVRDTNPIDWGTLAVGSIRIVDDDAPPTLLPGAGEVVEGDAGAVLEVPLTMSAPTGSHVFVEWTTLHVPGAGGDQADPATDYVPSSGTLFYNFSQGETEKAAVIPIVDDDLFEADEYVVVSFKVTSGGATMGGFWGLGLGTIVDDEPPPRLVPGGAVVSEAAPDAALHVPLTLSAPAGRDIVVEWSTIHGPDAPDGAATPGLDYVASSGTLTFPADSGVTQLVAIVPVLPDALAEGDEFVVVSFRVVSGGATMGGFWGLGFGLIVDDEHPG